eukprot:5623566-Pyramimonas_sp.AAC.1
MLRAAATSDTPEQPDMHRLRLDGGPWPRAAGFPAATGFALEYTNPGAHMCLGYKVAVEVRENDPNERDEACANTALCRRASGALKRASRSVFA